MSTVTIEIENEQLDAIVKQELSFMMNMLQNDLARIEENEKGYVFHTDWEEDRKEVKKHIKSFKRVLRYYGVEEL